MKITFFDTLPHEEKFIKNNLPEGVTAEFEEMSLHPNNDISPSVFDSDIISVFTSSLLNKDALACFKNLKFILLRSVGYSHVDLSYAKERGINVFNAPNYGDYTVAEYVFALLLAVSRRIILSSSSLKQGNILPDHYMGVELFDKTMGVIGTGAIGSKVVKIAQGFSMNVIAYDINETLDVPYVSLDELCAKADVISINAPLTPETARLFDRNRISKLKRGVIIVNTARGEIIDTEALYEALSQKKVAYAALDVVECEDILWQKPQNSFHFNGIKESCLKNFLIANRLLKMENVLITPHTAYDTREATGRILEITLQNLASCLNFSAGAKNLVLL